MERFMTDEISFEEALQQLEEIVNKLEEGDVPLEKAIEYYAQGSKLSKLCHEKLSRADQQLKEIVNEDGEKEPFIIQEEEK